MLELSGTQTVTYIPVRSHLSPAGVIVHNDTLCYHVVCVCAFLWCNDPPFFKRNRQVGQRDYHVAQDQRDILQSFPFPFLLCGVIKSGEKERGADVGLELVQFQNN